MLTLPDVQIRQRDFLLQISRAITAQLELDEVLRRVLQASVVMTAAKVGLVALNVEQRFVVRAYSGLDDEQVATANAHLESLVESISRHGDPALLDRELKALAVAIDPALRQALALPLIFAGVPLGLLIVFRTYSTAISPNDVQMLQSFADQAAIAVKNAQLYAAVSQERQQLQAILDHSADGVMILDRDLTIQQFNEALVRMTGWNQRDAVGADHDAIIRWAHDEHADLREVIDHGYPFNSPVDPAHNTLYVEGDLICKNGQTLSVGITYAPMLTPENTLANVIANVRDITTFRQAQEAQNTFISVISHELKTPVAIIKGYAATLRREDAQWDESTVRETLAIIEDEADRLGLLIQDLLTTSKLHVERQIALDIGDVWLPELVNRVVERFKTQTEQHHFTVRFAPGFPSIHGDEMRLRQLIENLIGNAIKYSPASGTVDISGRFDEDWIEIEIRDEGIGISQTDQARIFERFYRAEGSLRRSTQGTGLGLYLAKAIVDAHHGVIDVESKLGEGSTFFVRLPRNLTL
ncbi:MAG: putative two-component sensor histidine kinase [Chloroflexi bacterium OLB13]|nr:MAG: putative two-component sensor histidine kinase [Chloroflexi bacterium OLB13]GIK27595.1 MAG: histidine kinase [Chloroflexota bacterium]